MEFHHVIAAAVFILAGFIHGASGFGSGLTMMGLLPFTKEATIIVALILPFVSAQILWRLRRQASLRCALPYLAGAIGGTPVGVEIFRGAGAPALKIIIGVTLAVFCGYMLVSRRQFRIRGHWALSFGAGLLGGVIGGATNCGGPPLVLYIYMQDLTKEETSATLQILFVIMTIYKIGLFLARGLIAPHHVSSAAVFLIFIFAGIALGFALFRRIDTERLRKYVYVMLFLVGLSLIGAAAKSLAASAALNAG